jgi:hypothetical protein
MTAGYRSYVSVAMTDTWRSRLHQSMLSRLPGTTPSMRMQRGDCLLQGPADAVALVHHIWMEQALLQQRSQGGSTSGTPTLGTTGAGCRLCLNHGPPILPETTRCRVLGAALQVRLWETIRGEERPCGALLEMTGCHHVALKQHESSCAAE